MTLHVIISGKVQGVGFRNYLRSKARKMGITGWTRNIDNGQVEAEFEGRKDRLDQILKLSRRGPFLAEVISVEVKWIDKDSKYSSFEVIK